MKILGDPANVVFCLLEISGVAVSLLLVAYILANPAIAGF